jgi:hypothetical protein
LQVGKVSGGATNPSRKSRQRGCAETASALLREARRRKGIATNKHEPAAGFFLSSKGGMGFVAVGAREGIAAIVSFKLGKRIAVGSEYDRRSRKRLRQSEC